MRNTNGSAFSGMRSSLKNSLVPSARVFRLEGSLQAVVDRIALDLNVRFKSPIIANQKSGVHQMRLDGNSILVERDLLSNPSVLTRDLIRSDYAVDYRFLARFGLEPLVVYEG